MKPGIRWAPWRRYIDVKREREAEAAFTRFLKKHLPANSNQWEKTVLVELNDMSSSHIAYSYLSNVISEEFSASVASFSTRGLRWTSSTWLTTKLSCVVKLFLRSRTLRIYRSFGARRHYCPFPTGKERAEAKKIVTDLLRNGPDKRDIEALTVQGMRIGDLFYDSYLRTHSVPTLDLDSPKLKSGLIVAVEEAITWLRFLKESNVAAVLGSHAGYLGAIPLRAAAANGISAFEVTLNRVFRITRDRPIDSDFRDFPEIFASFSAQQKEAAHSIAAERLRRRFGGEVGVDMPYSQASAYLPATNDRLLHQSEKPKVLVAAHCFFDNPHCWGDNLFPDFWEWLCFLGDFSSSVDYDWYIKTHPDVLPGNDEILEEICERYPQLSILPSSASHHQIISEGITAVLTVYGTIGFEYAYLGVPVINASVNNPHIMYDFNFHPASVEEYAKLLRAIPRLPVDDHREKVVEYYYMKNIYGNSNLFFSDWKGTLDSLGGYLGQFSPLVSREFLGQVDSERDARIRSTLRDFVISGSHRLYVE